MESDGLEDPRAYGTFTTVPEHAHADLVEALDFTARGEHDDGEGLAAWYGTLVLG